MTCKQSILQFLAVSAFALLTQALIDYKNGKPWIEEISAFVDEVIGGGPVVLVVRGHARDFAMKVGQQVYAVMVAGKLARGLRIACNCGGPSG